MGAAGGEPLSRDAARGSARASAGDARADRLPDAYRPRLLRGVLGARESFFPSRGGQPALLLRQLLGGPLMASSSSRSLLASPARVAVLNAVPRGARLRGAPRGGGCVSDVPGVIGRESCDGSGALRRRPGQGDAMATGNSPFEANHLRHGSPAPPPGPRPPAARAWAAA